jgi:hypothetical protein
MQHRVFEIVHIYFNYINIYIKKNYIKILYIIHTQIKKKKTNCRIGLTVKLGTAPLWCKTADFFMRKKTRWFIVCIAITL